MVFAHTCELLIVPLREIALVYEVREDQLNEL